MTFALQIIVTGLVTGSIYMLIALGVTLLFGIMRVVNFVHGELCMLSAFAVYYVSVLWGMPFLVGVAAAILFSAIVAVLCQKLLFKPLNYDILTCFILGVGASFAIRSATWAVVGPEPVAIPPTFPGVFVWNGVYVAKQRVFAAVLCSVLAIALAVFLRYTRPGRAMRAVEQDREAALLMGINPESVYVTVFVISAMLAAVGGAMLGTLFGADPEMGADPLLKSFIIVQIGGMGSILGTVIAGLAIGLSDSVTGTVFGGELAFIFDFAILMIFLIVRPRGLFGYDV
ncbi:MAG TPA: branched-chain amino acid ABC transporter permease [Rhodopila sp.]|uniref:branched-chain amino acid ABC transporter permease n=1 Tax=Rhodopila sp. TaxID=2480087 RepID=UPI002BE45582|nr:branched-chain amino acid ABC transporter permease [Rhodopila sp.]HVY14323.1 branched-chain amino acid ABC transporter permease [Rhodopila sp.]